MTKTYRVAMIGCGKRAALHVPGLLADPRAEVVAVSDLRAEAAASIAAMFPNQPTVYDDHKAMLAAERIDLVISCLWTRLHLPIFSDCVAAGVRAVHSEKPMAPTWGETRAMAELAEQSGCLLTFSHQRRFCPGNLAVRRMIAEGRFGAITRLELYSPRHLLDCGTHSVDQALSFIGEVEAEWVLGAVDLSDSFAYFDVAAEACFHGHIQFAGGIPASFSVGLPDQNMGSGVRVHGERGFIAVTWDGAFEEAVCYDEPDWQPEPAPAVEQIEMRDMVSSLFDNLDSDAEAELDWRKAYRAAGIIFALYESARLRQRVTLPVTIDDNPVHELLARGQSA